MPDPNDYTSESDFIDDCILIRQMEHPEEDEATSAAVCYSMWDQREKDDN